MTGLSIDGTAFRLFPGEVSDRPLVAPIHAQVGGVFCGLVGTIDIIFVSAVLMTPHFYCHLTIKPYLIFQQIKFGVCVSGAVVDSTTSL